MRVITGITPWGQPFDLLAGLASLLDRPEWQEQAACRIDPRPEAWFPIRGDTPDHARHVCESCPVLDSCRDYALARPRLKGVWAGLTERERKHHRARHRVPLNYATRPQLDDVEHGTRLGYAHGCRCQPCTEANSQRRPAR